MEDERVFADTHALVLRWLREGVLDGLRVDHPDGLRDPEEYFERLRDEAPEAWIVVEKILEPGEPLRGVLAGRRGRPATTSSTGSAACSSIPRARGR